jgi:ankyrin repeat protein
MGVVATDPVAEKIEKSDFPRRLIEGKTRRDGETCLAIACEEGHLEIVQLIYERAANLESINSEGKTLLMLALKYGRGDAAPYLTSMDASITARDH